ncbi:MAG: hypothetical protein K2W33_00235 [Burkholderiales bacterium]|nr:hypothetical protein [Burkholderiales bacterium]
MLIIQPVSWTPASASTDWVWAQSRDGQTLTTQGCDPIALLPQDADVVLVLPVLSTSWHNVSLPKIGASRLRQALDGLLEDRLLTEPGQLHLAVQPGATAGQPTWVCACDKAALTAWLTLLDAANRPVGRIVPDQVPQQEPVWTALTAAGQAWWICAGPHGVWPAPLGPMGQVDPMASADSATAPPLLRTEPACASAAETAAGRPVPLETPAQRLLRSTQTGWNLAQFDLKRSTHNRRGQQLMQTARHVAYAPAWAAARWGLLALTVSCLLGLGASAWIAQQALSAKRQAIQLLLQQTFPHIALVLDAPLQMQREVDRLQRAQGSMGQTDFDTFLSDFGSVSPDEIRLNAIQFSATEISITLTGATDSNLPALQAALQQKGWQARYATPTMTLTRTAPTSSVMQALP